MKKFADTYIETGNATEAYKKAYSTKNMTTQVINNEASKTVRKPLVKEYIDNRVKKLDDAKIPKLKEVLAFFGGVMRGTIKDRVITKTGEIEVEPSMNDKISAGRELLKRYPLSDIDKAQIKRLQAEAIKAEAEAKVAKMQADSIVRATDASADKLSKLSTEDLRKLAKLSSGGDGSAETE